MPSTYTPLKIELIGNGEQSGTWGTTTNVNLGTALEEALVNTALVTFSSADVTLTLIDSNVSQPARNMRLNLLGASGGARNLIVPAIQKNYIVVNNLADTVTVKTSAGTGIAIPAGNTGFLYGDGTNVLQAFDFLPVAKFNSLTLTSPLPATSGGTGLASYSANGALFSPTSTTITSGTLPTTAGGTGLTSYTSGGAVYAASTSTLTTGTLPAASGGTGVTTTPANGQLLIGNGTGYTVANLVGVGITVTNSAGGITLTTTGLFAGGPLGTPSSGTLSNCTIDGTNFAGFRNVPVNSQSAAYTLLESDSGKVIFHPSTDANARTYSIPANSSVPYPLGTVLSFVNYTSQVVTIAITSDTMYLAGAGSTGSRSLAQYGMATALKLTTTTWLISGSGLT
jgi:hypothetical protein